MGEAEPATGSGRQGLVLAALILVAAVANLNLAVANVALPDIGKAFDASQTELNLVAVSYSLGLAASVLYLGALGDRYGRKMMLILGVTLSVPACLVAAWAPNAEVLIGARVLGGLSAGMAYPTTLALITALWSGPARTKSIALWSALGGAISSLGPLTAGALLEEFWWGSVFLITLPLAVVAFVMALLLVPSHVHETSDPVDNLGGILSIVLVASLVLAINFAPVPNEGALVAGLTAIAVAAGIAFFIRQRRARVPLYDLHVAGRRTFWVAACAGLIVFGTLMGAMFIGQQYLQNVLGYSTVEAGAAILPAAVMMVLIAPRSAKLVEASGARLTLLVGYACCFLGFVTMLLLWTEGQAYWAVGLGYALVGAGVGFAGTPASHSLTGSVPVIRAGMASGTADLQRDLGGAIMQSHPRCAAHGRVRGRGGRSDRRLAGCRRDHRQRADPAAEVVLQRRRHRRAVPAVRRPDHGRRHLVVPGRRRLGLRRRDHRHRGRGGGRRPALPAAGPGAGPARPVPRGGHRRPRRGGRQRLRRNRRRAALASQA